MGLLNAIEGQLHIGKDDKGNVIGLHNAKKFMEDLLGIIVDVNLKTENRKAYIVIKVEPYPISYKGTYHYRSGSTKQELKGAALDRF